MAFKSPRVKQASWNKRTHPSPQKYKMAVTDTSQFTRPIHASSHSHIMIFRDHHDHLCAPFQDEDDLKNPSERLPRILHSAKFRMSTLVEFSVKNKVLFTSQKVSWLTCSPHRHSIKSTNWLARKLWNYEYRFNKLIATLREPSQIHRYLVVTFTKCLLLRRWNQLRMHGVIPPWTATLYWTERSQVPNEKRHFVSAILFLRAWGRRNSG